jgi:hypothetical protein
MCPPNVVLDRVQRDKFERPLTAIRLTETRLGAEERPSRPKPLSTTHVNDIGAEMGHRHSPYQRSAGGIWSHATASSSRSNPGGHALIWAKPNRGSLFLTCAKALSGSR